MSNSKALTIRQFNETMQVTGKGRPRTVYSAVVYPNLARKTRPFRAGMDSTFGNAENA